MKQFWDTEMGQCVRSIPLVSAYVEYCCHNFAFHYTRFQTFVFKKRIQIFNVEQKNCMWEENKILKKSLWMYKQPEKTPRPCSYSKKVTLGFACISSWLLIPNLHLPGFQNFSLIRKLYMHRVYMKSLTGFVEALQKKQMLC